MYISRIQLLTNWASTKNCFIKFSELFVSFFQSFEAGIANAISSFKRLKNNSIYEKYVSPEFNYWSTEHLPKPVLADLVNCLWVFFNRLKLELLTQLPASNEWKIIVFMKNIYLPNSIID